ncbi:hypothetical protein [Motilibacter aurantiacus]|uniref:hypothetical protein n=1 Tax=Motilibacter aurantiacus TaxID=2714955 RepID=UPI00140E1A3A|nr:hypothetical protein [Motilibacter aurantiacus]NHC44678.1 hypothetical protein [Motilibacter aurantiacus]
MRRAPFRDARSRLAEELARRSAARPEEADLPPARGFEAHRALIAGLLQPPPEPPPASRRGRLLERVRRLRGGDAGAVDLPDPALLLEAAVRAQARLAAESRDEAAAAIAALVAHVKRTAELDWAADPRRWDAAVEEMLRFVVFDSDVPSRRAQEAWRRLWANRARSADPRLAVPLARALAAEERDWREAWDYWSATFELRGG